MVRAGIVGGAGYTAGELIRLLIHHPDVKLTFVHSTSNAGNHLYDVHEGLLGETELCFTAEFTAENIDVLFLCSAHGESCKFLEQNTLPERLKIIDLAQDFRDEHCGFVYGLPELQRERIQKAQRVANPGCFATAIQLALLPLAKAGLLSDDVHINAITGSTGAGVKPTSTSHFSWRTNNISAYKVFSHQHLIEIGRTLRNLQPNFVRELNFIPIRGDFARGIFLTAYTRCTLSEAEAVELYRNFYSESAFTFVSDNNPDLKQVVNTNKAVVYIKKYDDKLFIVAVIDNLLKGASGQAVQNMNLIFGYDEKTGLNLKASGF